MIAVSKITFQQMVSKTYPTGRDKTFVLDFVNDIEISSSWKNLTDTAKIILPKNVYVQTEHGNVAWADADLYANTNTPPIFLRGDKVTIELGYHYENEFGEWVTETNVEFQGWIASVNPAIPMEINCEDNMWLLKQAQCPNKVFPASEFNTKQIIEYLLQNATVNSGNPYLSNVILPFLKKIKVVDGVGTSAKISSSIGDFRTQTETIAGVLKRFRDALKFDCFFRGDDLYASGIVYYPSDYVQNGAIVSTAYDFEQNIITNLTNLVYTRKDDVRLGIKACSINKIFQAAVNSSGGKKTKQERLEVIVGDPDGDIRGQNYLNCTTIADLTAKANQLLVKLKYEGWRGSFTSYGLPFVRHGQAISLNSKITPERDGTYLAKSVNVKFSPKDGFKRIIEPHIRIDSNTGLTINDFANGL